MRSPDMSEASSAFSSGRQRSVNPASRAAAAIERTPRMGRSPPSRESSPAKSFPSGANFACFDASRKTSASGRSNTAPSFLRAAGASESTIFLLLRFGDSYPPSSLSVGIGGSEFFIAAAMRSFASSTDLSGSPTMVKACSPRTMSHSTETTAAFGSIGCAPKTRANPDAIFCFSATEDIVPDFFSGVRNAGARGRIRLKAVQRYRFLAHFAKAVRTTVHFFERGLYVALPPYKLVNQGDVGHQLFYLVCRIIRVSLFARESARISLPGGAGGLSMLCQFFIKRISLRLQIGPQVVQLVLGDACLFHSVRSHTCF